MTDRELMQQALDALGNTTPTGFNMESDKRFYAAITALRERLAQPEQTVSMDEYKRLQELVTSQGIRLMEYESEQEPVAWMNPSWIDPDTRGWASDSFESIQIEGWIPLYTAPRREWQGLTDEEVSEILDQEIGFNSCFGPETDFARAIEAKLREKNT